MRGAENRGVNLDEYPNVKRWFEQIDLRPAVQRGCEVLVGARKPLTDDKARELLFGAGQYRQR